MSKRYKFRQEYFGGVLYDLKEYEYLFCDIEVAKRIIEFNPSQVIDLVPGSLNNRAKTLVTSDGVPNYEILSTQPFPGWLSAPLQVYYDFTTMCNLRCPHCYTNSGKKSKNELSVREIINFADELQKNGVYKISLGGGEPLIHPDAEQIIRIFRDRDISVSLSTNGLLFEDGKWATIFNEIDLRTVTVSAEGGTEESYEAIRGKGNWERFICSMQAFKRDYKGRYAIRVTITNQTVNDVGAILQLGKEVGAYAVKFKFMQKWGRAKENEEIIPSADQNITVVKEALLLSKAIGIKVTVPGMFAIGSLKTSINRYIPLTISGEMPYKNGFGCGGGRRGIYVSENGDYSACVSMGPEYCSHNVRNTPLREAWLHGSGFKKMRALQGEEPCLSCDYLDECRGGCRARALDVFGNPNAVDPYCPIIGDEGLENRYEN